MHMYGKCNQNTPCGSRVITFSLTANRQTDERVDGRTHIVIIVQTQGSCNSIYHNECGVNASTSIGLHSTDWGYLHIVAEVTAMKRAAFLQTSPTLNYRLAKTHDMA